MGQEGGGIRNRSYGTSHLRKQFLSLVRGEGGEPRRPQHDHRPHWSARQVWVGLRKNWRGEKSPLNSCGSSHEKLESAQPASRACRFILSSPSSFQTIYIYSYIKVEQIFFLFKTFFLCIVIVTLNRVIIILTRIYGFFDYFW